MSENLLVGSKTRAALKAKGVNVGAGALDALNEVMHWYIDQAAKRAVANRRKTVRSHDFIADVEAEATAEAPAAVEVHEEPVEAAPLSVEPMQSPVADVGSYAEEAAPAETPAWQR